MTCYLWVAGKRFDVDDFLEKSRLKVDEVRYIGQPKYKDHPDKLIAKFNSFLVTISSAYFTELKKQIEDTIEYLRENKDTLKLIKQMSTIEYANLHFGVNGTFDKPLQTIYYPAELMILTGELGLSLETSIYKPDFFQTES